LRGVLSAPFQFAAKPPRPSPIALSLDQSSVITPNPAPIFSLFFPLPPEPERPLSTTIPWKWREASCRSLFYPLLFPDFCNCFFPPPWAVLIWRCFGTNRDSLCAYWLVQKFFFSLMTFSGGCLAFFPRPPPFPLVFVPHWTLFSSPQFSRVVVIFPCPFPHVSAKRWASNCPPFSRSLLPRGLLFPHPPPRPS